MKIWFSSPPFAILFLQSQQRLSHADDHCILSEFGTRCWIRIRFRHPDRL
ncbi:MAG: hypothetical protein KME16_15995 [Scytolyngbya sp. HA4215-MV1]|nr:hypothetical protein [Scytolyngbya sp. HA4215-MV1]